LVLTYKNAWMVCAVVHIRAPDSLHDACTQIPCTQLGLSGGGVNYRVGFFVRKCGCL